MHMVSCCRIACCSQPHNHLMSNTVNTGVRMAFPSADTESRGHFCLHTAAAQCNCKAFHTVTVECWLKGTFLVCVAQITIPSKPEHILKEPSDPTLGSNTTDHSFTWTDRVAVACSYLRWSHKSLGRKRGTRLFPLLRVHILFSENKTWFCQCPVFADSELPDMNRVVVDDTVCISTSQRWSPAWEPC